MGMGAVMAGASLLGSGIQAFGAKSASDSQGKAARMAAILQQMQFQQQMDFAKAQFANANEARALYDPYITRGIGASNALMALTGTGEGGDPTIAYLTKRFAPTMEELAQTPGYQFTLGQGLMAAQNSAAAKGLGSSGAAMRAAADYAEGLAGTTYQQQLQNYLNQNQLVYNMLAGQTSSGLQAAGASASLAGQLAGAGVNLLNAGNSGQQMIGNNLIQQGNAQAAGTLGTTSAIGNGLNNALGGYIYGNYMLPQMTGISASQAPQVASGNVLMSSTSPLNISSMSSWASPLSGLPAIY